MEQTPVETLLAEVDRYLEMTGLSPATLGKKAVNDGKCIDRLRGGKRAWPETVARIRQFMKDNPHLRGRGSNEAAA